MQLTNDELDAILAKADLRLAEPYHENQSYVKSRHLLTECVICGSKAHYTLKYIMEKTGVEPVCRTCFWWRIKEKRERPDYGPLLESLSSMGMQLPSWLSDLNKTDDDVSGEDSFEIRKEAIAGAVANSQTFTSSDVSFAKTNGFILLGKIQPSRYCSEALFRVQCESCGRITIERRGDVAWGCSCKRVPPSHTGKQRSTGTPTTANLLCKSDEPCVSWWDHERNAEEDFAKVKVRGRGVFWWKCPVCGCSFQKPVYKMTHPFLGTLLACPSCEEERSRRSAAEREKYKHTHVSEVPELLDAWDDDENDPRETPIFTYRQYRFKCSNGHHPRSTPYTFLREGCPFCKAARTRKALSGEPVYLRHTSPELAQEWATDLNGAKITPDNVKITSKRNVWWRCLECGHEWQLPVYQRNRSYGQACPKCGKVLNSFAWQYPGLAAEWSPNNPVSPWTIYPGASNLKFIPEWVCRNNPEHIWRAGLAGRVHGSECPECRDYGRSRVAMQHFDEVKKLFNTARCEVPLFSDSFSHNPWTVDILITTSTDTVAVEYDGAYWHMDKVETDVRKSKDLMKAGYRVLRLREDDLPSLDIDEEGYGELRVSSAAPDPMTIAEQIAGWIKTGVQE